MKLHTNHSIMINGTIDIWFNANEIIKHRNFIIFKNNGIIVGGTNTNKKFITIFTKADKNHPDYKIILFSSLEDEMDGIKKCG